MKNRKIDDTSTRWHVLGDPEAVAVQAAQRILQAASRAITGRSLFRIVLAGGRTPEAAPRLLVDADTDWSRGEIYFGDERCLPVDDAQRNSLMAARALLDSVSVPAANVHPILGWRDGERLPIAEIGGPAQVNVLLDKAAQA